MHIVHQENSERKESNECIESNKRRKKVSANVSERDFASHTSLPKTFWPMRNSLFFGFLYVPKSENVISVCFVLVWSFTVNFVHVEISSEGHCCI